MRLPAICSDLSSCIGEIELAPTAAVDIGGDSDGDLSGTKPSFGSSASELWPKWVDLLRCWWFAVVGIYIALKKQKINVDQKSKVENVDEWRRG